MATRQPPLAAQNPWNLALNWRALVGVPALAPSGPSLPLFVRSVYYLFVFSLPFGSLNSESFSTHIFSLPKVIGYILFAVALAQPHWGLRNNPKPFWYFWIYILAFFFVTALQDPEYQPASLDRLAQVIQLLILFRICYNLMLGKRMLDHTVVVLVASCATAAMLGFLGIGAAAFATAHAGDRYGFLSDDPNSTGAFFGLGFIAAVSLGHERRDLSRITRRTAWAAAAILLASTLRTASRTALVALAAALLCLVLKKKGRLLAGVLLLLLLGLLIALSLRLPVVEYRMQETLVYGNTSQRTDLFFEALRMFVEKPLFGWGPTVNVIELGHRFGFVHLDTHNLYTWVLTETGLVGGGPYIFALLLTLTLAWRARSSSQGILPFSLLVFLLFFNMGITWFNYKQFWVVLAYACASQREVAMRRPVGAVLSFNPAHVSAPTTT
jgi:O-antigen ligase